MQSLRRFKIWTSWKVLPQQLNRVKLARLTFAAAAVAACFAWPATAGAVPLGLYFSNYNSGQLLKVSATAGGVGVPLPLSPGGILSNPQNPVLGRDGNIYLPDAFDKVVYKINPNTFAITTFAVGPTEGVGFGVFDNAGNYFLTNFNGNKVRKYNSSGAFVADILVPGNPAGIALGPDGYLYVSSYTSGVVRRYDPATGTQIGGTFASAPGKNLTNLVFGPDGSLYAGNASLNVTKFSSSGALLTNTFLSTNIATGPRGMAFGPDGYLYIGDNNSVLRYTSAGVFSNVFATSTTSPGFVQGLLFVVPEPSCLALLALGSVGLLLIHRRRNRR